MGWAKYYEDNMEITNERYTTMRSRTREPEIKVVCTTILPATEIIFQNKEETLEQRQEEFEDKYIFCRECGRKFSFTAVAQKHYNRMGWDAPKRCKCCRSYRKTRHLMRSSF